MTSNDDNNIELTKESSNSDEILHDFLPFLRVYKDGRIERYILTSREKPGNDPITGVQSKDIVISTDPEISGRMFLPKIENRPNNDDNSPKKNGIPLLVHFHGGGFCTGSAFGPITKQYLNNLVSMAQVMAFSVEYRLAPESPLPIAYDDCWAAFKWIASHVNGNGPDPWLNEYVDFDRVFLGGDSTGATIAHDVAIRASVEPLEGLNFVGLLAIHPYFGSKEPEKLIKYLDPTSSGCDDDPRMNPGVDPRLCKLACEKVLVCVAEYDKFKDRGITYAENLETMWEGKVEIVETLGEGHCFHVLDATSPNIEHFMAKLASFIK
ncbi:hypothetical protein BVRB_9g218700 [Beta vulgaris subsp. vulgaris]|uniref:2-hydroxyisoflavanone dehydratase n=1 Tax=Beta vulgaris subsp. vulgaris TaxID=3555 RepID=UPI00053F95E6|nr:2-hydroxyisoflavanone dehydratase [Beta vulgaris subsp. vulgaris]KMT00572.1 hypothetical protein BVRB_9g218700 [Beta vulgaris subsp. vulgaris]